MKGVALGWQKRLLLYSASFKTFKLHSSELFKKIIESGSEIVVINQNVKKTFCHIHFQLVLFISQGKSHFVIRKKQCTFMTNVHVDILNSETLIKVLPDEKTLGNYLCR